MNESPTHLTTMPGVGDVTAAKLMGRIGPIDGFKSANQLARHAGIAPRENSSGGIRRKWRSKSGDRQLNTTIHLIALNQIAVTRDGRLRCPIAHQYYQRKIAEGKTKLSARTCLTRRLCDIIFAMLRDRTPYKMPQPANGPVEQLSAVA
jgi:transposase